MKNHKYYELGYRAHTGTSFSPERRAESECKFYDETIKELQEIGADESGIAKFERLFVAQLSAKSNCLSTMITGGSNFPVRRAEKANERERRASDELFDYLERLKKAVDKQNHPEKYPTVIRSDDENAVDKLKEKLAKLEKAQEQMKACNKIVKDKKENKIERLAGILGSEKAAKELMEPDFCNRIGFASFSLTNNNANIKATKDRIEQLEKAATLETKEIEIAGVKVVQNAELMRIQFFFDGKPERAVIDLMKKHGFKWSPSNMCWQRLWNNNALFSIKHYIKPELEKLLISNN
jgi:hypothetical protein